MKKFLPILLIGLMTSTAYATTAKIVPGQPKFSKGVTGGYEITKFETYPLSESKKKGISSARTITKVTGASGKAVVTLRLDSYHSYEICNTEDYAAYFQLNVALSDSLRNSASNSDHALVPAKTCASGNSHLFMNSTYERPGTFYSYASTDVDGQQKTTDQNTINISKK